VLRPRCYRRHLDVDGNQTGIAAMARRQLQFELEGDYVELNQLLKLVGLCDSGGAGKALVASGVVSVDGEVELRKTRKVRAGERVTLGDIGIEVRATPADPASAG
jgi:ribosome-associated protein